MAVVCAYATAQTTQGEFLEKYNLLSTKLGVDGVGIETLLTKWETAFPEDQNMLVASFLYYYTKCQTQSTISSDKKSYMGQKPLLQLKDSLDRPVYYFYDTQYDDEMFGKAMQYIEKANQQEPDKLENRFAHITALVNYEKESPDMALSKLKELVDFNYNSHPSWIYNEEKVDEEFFKTSVQEYCFSFFNLSSAAGYEAFRQLSEKMLQYNADDVLFLDNVGSYYLVGKKDYKTALKYYTKVLKIKADDITAIRNCVVLARNSKNVKLEKKYLPMILQYSDDESTRKSAQVRLDYLNGVK